MNPIKRITQAVGIYFINRQLDVIAKTIPESKDEYFGIGEHIHLPDGFHEVMNAYRIEQINKRSE